MTTRNTSLGKISFRLIYHGDIFLWRLTTILKNFQFFYFSYRLFSFLKVCHPRNQYCDADDDDDADADALIHASPLYSNF